MQKIKKTINKLFPYLILITLFSVPFQIRKVVFPVFESGYFHETLSVSMYFTDILIILCITCGLVVYRNVFWDYLKKKWKDVKSRFIGKLPLSEEPPLNPLLLASIRRSGPKEGRTLQRADTKNPLFWLALFILWQCATLFRANSTGIALFKIFKITEMTLFGVILYLTFNQIQASTSPPNPPARNASHNDAGGLLREAEKHRFACFSVSDRFPSRDGLFLVSCFLVLSGTIQSLWAILQFIFQRSLGFTWLKESVLSPDIPGVAKIIINGQKYIRAYGGLPHPNILAGFLVVSIVCTILILRIMECRDEAMPRLYEKDSLPPSLPLRQSGISKLTLLSCKSYTRPHRYANITNWLNQNPGIQKENFNDKNLILKRFGQAKLTLVSCKSYTKLTLVLKISLFLQLTALILTGSISGFLALLVFSAILFSSRDEAMPRLYNKDNQKSTLLSCNHYTRPHRYANITNWLNQNPGIQKENFNDKNLILKRFGQAKLTLLLYILVILAMPAGLFYLRSGDLIRNGNSISERLDQYITSKEILSENKNMIFGVGAGNYVDYLRQAHLPLTPSSERRRYYPWQKQPVHNVFTLILTENGGVGLILFLIFFILMAYQIPLIMCLLPILLLDHYLWTTQQGTLIFMLFVLFSFVFEEK